MSDAPAPKTQSLSLMLRRSATRHTQKPALIFEGESWSYTVLDRLTDELAEGLRASGVRKGDRVAILARNSHAFMAIRFAVARIAAVLVPINVMLGAEEVRYILDHSGASTLFVDGSLAALAAAARTDAIREVFIVSADAPVPDARSWRDLLVRDAPTLDEADGNDLLQIIYTSGTESRPKGAMLTHAAVLWQYQSCLVDCEWTSDTIALHALPLFHCAQLDAMMGPALQVGATNVITASATSDAMIPLIAQYGISSIFAPPTVWISLLRSPLFDGIKLATLRKGYYGASIMPVAVLEEIATRLPQVRLWNLYGQTEIAPLAAVLGPDDHRSKLGAAGRPALNVQTRIVDDLMRDVPLGEIGEIVHRSPQLLTGYWRQPDLTDAAFAGGWFHSGDLAVMDEDGFITVVDRKKDMIKSGGENVSSREVEEAIYLHPDISEVAVIGLPDPRWIEAVTAFVVVRQGATITSQALQDHCASHLATFKRPKRIVFVEDLPRNASGKILKQVLRRDFGLEGTQVSRPA